LEGLKPHDKYRQNANEPEVQVLVQFSANISSLRDERLPEVKT
jgi:hypothetical protein